MASAITEARYDLDRTAMLAKCQRLQWSVDDIPWDGAGADVVDDDLRARLSAFMADLHWIEAIAAIAFRAMARREPDPTLAAIFASFALDEQRHSDAELLLMRRWGIVRRGESVPLNKNARNLLVALERGADHVHPAIFSAIIPFTELVLDGALVKHLDAEVADPVSNEVFRRINADEARHLAVDFHVLERTGATSSLASSLGHMATAIVHPVILYGLLLGYLPLLPRMRKDIALLGIPDRVLVACVERYIALGDESPGAARHPTYVFFRWLSRDIARGERRPLELLMRLSDVADSLGLRLSP
jgi:hypothetical protein